MRTKPLTALHTRGLQLPLATVEQLQELRGLVSWDHTAWRQGPEMMNVMSAASNNGPMRSSQNVPQSDA